MMGRCWQQDLLMLVLSTVLAMTALGVQRSGRYMYTVVTGERPVLAQVGDITSTVLATLLGVAAIVVLSLMLLRLFDRLREGASDV